MLAGASNFFSWLIGAFDIAPRARVMRMTRQSEPALFWAIIAWIAVTSITPIATVLAMGRVVTYVGPAAREGMSSVPGHRLVMALVVFGVLFAISLADGPAQTALQMATKNRLTFQLQSRLMSAVNGPVGIGHLEEPEVLDQLALAQGSLMSFYPGDAPMTFAMTTTRRLQGAFGCIVVGAFRWWLGLVIALFWIAASYALHRNSKKSVRTYTGNASPMRRAFYFYQLATRPDAAKELRVFGLGGWIVDGLKRRWADGMAPGMANARTNRLTQVEVQIAGLFVYTGAFLYLALIAYHHGVGIGELAVLISMLRTCQSLSGVNISAYNLHWMLSAFPHLEQVESSLASRSRAVGGSRLPTGLPASGIRFDALSFRYPGAARDVFDGLTLDIPAGRSTAIVGVNGAGKTTLVKLLARLHEPTGGRILVDGSDLGDFDAREWQRRIAVVFQDFNHYPLSVSENIGFGAIEHLVDIDGIEAAARLAGIDGFARELPHGWQTRLSKEFENGTDLSGGQWQRLALARALFAARHGAGVLVLDEPTAWLDVRGEAAFYDRFLEITRGLTTVVISHRFSTVRLADRICVISDGAVIETGSHDELLANNGTYAQMFRLQAARFVENDGSERGVGA